jgi:hypothetical protein
MKCPRCDSEALFINEFANAKQYSCINCLGFFFTMYKDERLSYYKFILGERSIYVSVTFSETIVYHKGKTKKKFPFIPEGFIKKNNEELTNWLQTIMVFQ